MLESHPLTFSPLKTRINLLPYLGVGEPQPIPKKVSGQAKWAFSLPLLSPKVFSPFKKPVGSSQNVPFRAVLEGTPQKTTPQKVLRQQTISFLHTGSARTHFGGLERNKSPRQNEDLFVTGNYAKLNNSPRIFNLHRGAGFSDRTWSECWRTSPGPGHDHHHQQLLAVLCEMI